MRDRTYLELDILYAEYANPIGKQRLPEMRQKDGTASAVYRRWRELKA
ncbi:hypothetical protein IHE49_03725 [Rhodanobacter sp. 7MK24]|nr:hypothetical protein [Rhodanobacter sp. 7MK24]